MELLNTVQHEPPPRPLQCDWNSCNKSFNRKSDLQRHCRIHTKERPYSCSIPGCGKKFAQRSALKVHIRTHTGEKPYHCQFSGCSKQFSDSSSFARHRRIHTSKRPHKCGHYGCSKAFSRKDYMVEHQRRPHKRGLRPNKILDDCFSNSDMSEALLTPSQTANPRPLPAVVPDESTSENNHLMHGAAFVPDINQTMHQYKMQNFADSSIQQPYYVFKHDDSDIAPKSTNIQPPFQVPRSLGPPISGLEMACFTQSMTTPSYGPGLSPVTYQSSPDHYNFDAPASPDHSQALHSAPAIQQQSMSQDTWQATQQTQANAEHCPPTVGVEQFHTVVQHDLASEGHGQFFEQEYVYVNKPEDGGLYGCNVEATDPNYHPISQAAKFDFGKLPNTLTWPMCSYTPESVAQFDLNLFDGAQYLDQYAAPAGELNRSFMPVAACY